MKRWIAVLLIAVLSVGLLAGCAAPQEEGGAVVDTYVEGETHTPSGDAPSKDQNPQETPDVTPDQTPNQTPDNQPDETPQETPQETPDQQPGNTPQETPDEGTGEEEPTITYDPKNHIKVADYNIRCANDPDGNSIAERAPRFLEYIKKHDPDIIGLQEAVPEWIHYLEMGIDDYDALTLKYEMRFKYRAESSRECTPLLWKKDKFALLDEGYYWLSETPEMESKGWGAKHYRICNWVKLKVKATGKIFIFVNTHLQGGTPAYNSAGLIATRTKQIGGFDKYPVILTGDFNYAPWSDPYTQFIAVGFQDLNDELGFNDAYTNNGYNTRKDKDSGNSIKDYIMFGGDQIIPLKYQVMNEKYYDGWISDHRGLIGEFALK